MTKALSTEFQNWMQEMGYIDEEGVLLIKLREAQALWYQTCIQEDRAEIEKRFVRIAKSLWAVYSQGYWQELELDNFEQFLKSPEVDISVSAGYDLQRVGMYLEQGLFTEKQAAEIGPSKLRALLPAIKKDPENIAELLDKASVLNYLDLTDEVVGREVAYYKGRGPLPELIEELEGRPEFWEGDVTLNAKTC